VEDLAQGRVWLLLSGPVSWPRLVAERLLALVAGVVVLTASGLAALALSAAWIGEDLEFAGIVR
jgi:hypothetical protein